MRLTNIQIMKRLIFISVLFLVASQAVAQSQNGQQWDQYYFTGSMAIGKGTRTYANGAAVMELGNDNAKLGLLGARGYKDSIQNPVRGLQIYDIPTLHEYVYNGTKWVIQLDSTNNTGDTTNTIATKYYVDSVANSIAFPSLVPTSGLTITYNSTTSNAIQLEKGSAGTISLTFNWSGGRQKTSSQATNTLSTINVNSVNQSFSQPGSPGTASGTSGTTLAINTNGSYQNIVTTTDNKTATSTATVTWYNKWYYGFVTAGDNSPSDADIKGLAGQAFNTSRTQPNTIVSNSTPSLLVIAFLASLDPGNISQIYINGFNSTGAFTRTVRNFTNASGDIESYIIYVQNTPTSAGLTFNIQ